MITLDEFLKTEQEKLEEDSERVLSILRLNEGSVAIQSARWGHGGPDSNVSSYFGLESSRLYRTLLYLRRKGLLRYGAVDETHEVHRGTPRFGRLYFWIRLTPSYKKSLQVCEITA